MCEVECQSGKPVVSTLDTARNTDAAVSLALDVHTSGICGVHGVHRNSCFSLILPACDGSAQMGSCFLFCQML